ncbi:MAG: nucleotidyltransferase family protein [Gammaproteobacteria bacterium]|nr:nucleotidyltransferase family protein [Gammaproteobacteria bacterium]
MRRAPADKTIVGILLAAGSSQRFGADKLLQPLPAGEPVAVAAAKTLVAAIPRSLAVVRSGDGELAAAMRAAGLDLVVHADAQRGIGSSIAAGVKASAAVQGWVIALADMPWIEVETIQQVHSALAADASLAAPSYSGQRGHPVGFASRWLAQLVSLDGDSGARDLLKEHRRNLTLIETGDAGVLRDVDHPGDLLIP